MKVLIYLTIFLMLGTWFASCRSIKEVPVETIRTEYKYIDRLQHDSIYVKDSVRYYTKGDTVFADKYLYRYKYLFINRVDSFVKVDSVQVPYLVEKQLSRWEKIKIELGGWAFWGIIIFALIFVKWFLYRWRKGREL